MINTAKAAEWAVVSVGKKEKQTTDFPEFPDLWEEVRVETKRLLRRYRSVGGPATIPLVRTMADTRMKGV